MCELRVPPHACTVSHMTSNAIVASAAAALELSTDAMRDLLVADLAAHGVHANWTDSPAAKSDAIRIGSLVAVYAHQRIRIARVWKITPSKVSALYVTPSVVESAARNGHKPYLNNITDKIANTEVVVY